MLGSEKAQEESEGMGCEVELSGFGKVVAERPNQSYDSSHRQLRVGECTLYLAATSRGSFK